MVERVYVKICGLREPAHVRVALEAGADAVGVVMNATSSRRATDEEARSVVSAAQGRMETVLVVNDIPAAEAAERAVRLGFDVVQLHGPAYDLRDVTTVRDAGVRVWRATSVAHACDLRVGALGEERLLLDAPRPGSGEVWDFSALEGRTPSGEWLLAGGLSPDNVAAAIAQLRPWGVDVSSGVERAPGEKDPDLIRAFVASARA